VGHLQILVTRREAMPADDFNSALRLGLGEAAHREGVERLVLHLIDEEAAAVGAGALANPASFHALVGVGVADGAGAGPEQGAGEAVLEVACAVGDCHAYRADYRVIREHEGVSTGERTPGVVMASLVRRAPALDPGAFDAYWQERHAPLALAHHVGMWDYRQISVREALPGTPPGWDGVALMGFRTVRDFETGLFDSDAGRKTIMADTERFLALDRGETAMMGEYWLRA